MTSGALLQVQQMITTAAAILPQTTGQAQLTEATRQQPSSEKASAAPVKWNAPVLTKKVQTLAIFSVLSVILWCAQNLFLLLLPLLMLLLLLLYTRYRFFC